MNKLNYSMIMSAVYVSLLILIMLSFTGCSMIGKKDDKPVSVPVVSIPIKVEVPKLLSKSAQRKQNCVDRYLQEFSVDKSVDLCKYILVRPNN